ncbi:MAG: DUF2254 domain-containing protein [Actinomycetales bacterium]|nr:DUF2254 domain-containing protein [Actinomycetales bacterium]
MQVAKILSHLRHGLWFIPLVYGVAGLILNVITTTLDSMTDFRLIPLSVIGGPDAALGILGAVAASMISLVATVLSITMVVVQLAMGQFSPRIVQTFLQDRVSTPSVCSSPPSCTPCSPCVRCSSARTTPPSPASPSP